MPEKRKNRQEVESSFNPDGFRVGVMNDSLGVEHGVYLDNKSINPQEIADIRNESIDTIETNADQEKKSKNE